MVTAIFSYNIHLIIKCLVFAVDENDVKVQFLYLHFLSAGTHKGPKQLANNLGKRVTH